MLQRLRRPLLLDGCLCSQVGMCILTERTLALARQLIGAIPWRACLGERGPFRVAATSLLSPPQAIVFFEQVKTRVWRPLGDSNPCCRDENPES